MGFGGSRMLDATTIDLVRFRARVVTFSDAPIPAALRQRAAKITVLRAIRVKA